MQATEVTLNFSSIHILKSQKKEVYFFSSVFLEEYINSIFHLTQYIKNIIISTYNKQRNY